MNTMHRTLSLIAIAAMGVGLTSCASTREWADEHRTQTGAIAGAVLGATAGALIDDNPWRGAVVGGAAGAAVGTGIGYVLQRQKEAFERIEGLEAQQTQVPVAYYPDHVTPGEPAPQPTVVEREALRLRLEETLNFPQNIATVSPEGIAKLREIAEVLRENPNSDVFIKGYASLEGTDKENIALSERRAEQVRNHLIDARVSPSRLIAIGMGTANPIASNETEAGRAQNRRVELEVIPREEVR